jgi:hypothetical protein
MPPTGATASPDPPLCDIWATPLRYVFLAQEARFAQRSPERAAGLLMHFWHSSRLSIGVKHSLQ